MVDYEKMGVFYLGRVLDPETGESTGTPLLYASKDLCTHAVCVGMTGSGKTGLGVTLLEEAAIDGIPALVIDPKGDMGNLCLTFPKLRSEDFEPWIDPEAASRAGTTVADQAAKTAKRWREGLADWDQDGARIERLRSAAEVAIYSPGSTGGRPLSLLDSLGAPPAAVAGDPDALRERVSSAVAGLLALLGIDADPLRSREHILLSMILARTWEAGRNLDLGDLIRAIQEPPFQQIGVLDLESFYPAKDRFGLAMDLNNLLASPGFAAWREGEPLDIARLLYTPEGRPRIAVISIAHLSDTERMFCVTWILNEFVAWMRSQSGTGSLRALLYMDEVFGYLPPTANPPSKLPLLTLLKQARAFGIGVVLATQNPVDLDYKALSNAGTWLLGRLQTERDKQRIADGLEGASTAAAAFDRKRLETLLSGLATRRFLMVNVHDDAPTLFESRWALSYLRGPLSREQIRSLSQPVAATAPAPKPSRKPAASKKPARKPTRKSRAEPGDERPLLPAEIDEVFLGEGNEYRAALAAEIRIHYVRTGLQLDHWEQVRWRVPFDPDESGPLAEEAEDLSPGLVYGDSPREGARFAPLPKGAAKATSYRRWSKALRDHVYRTRPITLYRCKPLKLVSRPGETEGEFRIRTSEGMREKRDLALEKLQERFAPKLARGRERIAQATERVDREAEQAQHATLQAAVSVGATVLGALFGRKMGSSRNVGRATTAARGFGRSSRERGDVRRAKERVEIEEKKLRDLEADFEARLAKLREEHEPANVEIEELEVPPRKSDLTVQRLALAWVPGDLPG
ncbi:MAG: hypothetical protein OEP95_03565 [Myxococcales bacterium]|nr:hypothetical protein [Myxococcales bacterium]